jgi:1-deoxy-D-xylulose-5-phosphate synthase
VLRFPKGDVGSPIAQVRQLGNLDVLHESGPDAVDLLIVGVGAMASTAVSVAEKLEAQGHSVRVVDPRWVIPVSPDLVRAAEQATAVAVIEDNLVSGGIGSAVALAMSQAGHQCPVRCFGIPKEFLDHASRSEVLERIGLTPDAIATSLGSSLAHLTGQRP